MKRKKIFLDIGAHEGETLYDILTEAYFFDEIHCFEPMAKPFAKMKSLYTGQGTAKVFFHNFGLSSTTDTQEIFGAGAGASMFSDKVDVDAALCATCSFVRASEFFQEHLKAEDLIIVKINCEGGEVPILYDLIASKEMFKADHLMVDFDARKIPSQRNAPKDLMKKLKAIKYKNYTTPRAAMRGKTHSLRLRNWLGLLACAPLIMARPLTFAEKTYAHIMKYKFYLPLKYVKKADGAG